MSTPFTQPSPVLILCAALAVLLAFGTFGFWKRLSLRCGLMDEPGRRKIHRKPTSLAGGLTVLMAALPFCLYYFYTLPGGGGSLHWFWLGGLLAFFLLGLADDYWELGPGVKFLFQLLLIGGLTTRIHFEFFASPAYGPTLNFALSFLWFGFILNSLNFLDNMNGLCAGLGGLLATAYFLAGSMLPGAQVLPVFLIFAAALLAFLPWNYPKAKAFLGDSGSHLVGYLAATGSILLTNALLQRAASEPGPVPMQTLLAFLPVLLMLSLPLYDLGSTFLIRLRNGRPIYVGDTNHISHRLVRKGLSPAAAVAALWALCAATLALSLLWISRGF
jgi:UDP-GlcNAc:undecaprenyl-phosphate GlcNAc-1-phosphate transferase